MRVTLLIPLLAAGAFAQSSARIEGTVLSETGDPLRKAIVRLQMISGRGATSNYTGTTDSEGRFVFEEVAPGRFELSAERTGFVKTFYGAARPSAAAKPSTVAPGQKRTGIVVKMAPQALIAGKVVDEDGDAMAGGQVL